MHVIMHLLTLSDATIHYLDTVRLESSLLRSQSDYKVFYMLFFVQPLLDYIS